MSKKQILCVMGMIIPSLVLSGTAFGWAGNSHATLCQKTFDDPVVSPLLSGIDQSAIEGWIGEPGDYQNGQWSNIAARAYIDTGVSPNGLNWQGLSETDRLKYLQHNTTDVGVPVGHSPASYDPGGYTNTVGEAILEAQVATWSTYPSVVGTSNYTHSRTGQSYSFTGTYDQVLNTFYNACRENMTWYKSTKNWLGLHSIDDNRAAAWNGTTIGLMLQRATFVDYFLAKQAPVVTAGNYVGYTGGSVTFDQSSSYDPDCVSWNSNGTYSQIYGTHAQGMQYFLWDLNADVYSGGAWDYVSTTPYLTLTTAELLAMGLPANQWNLYYVAGVDNEGKSAAAAGYVWAFGGGAIPEPATLSLLAVGGVALLRRKQR